MRVHQWIIIGLASLVLAGCGVRGALEPPPSAQPAAQAPDGAPVQQPQNDNPFVLDALLL